MGYLRLLSGLLKISLVPLIIVALVAVGQLVALWLWGLLTAYELRRADRLALRDRLACEAEDAALAANGTRPADVVDLAVWRKGVRSETRTAP